ncbi:hypothetical protein AMECASPLE_035041 [Ameca splendens]|uniref:Uncharacterized protein n=1 Tax=Ameca splendens TaxID=208324 RepID=A0ABV0YIL2_9TELE
MVLEPHLYVLSAHLPRLLHTSQVTLSHWIYTLAHTHSHTDTVCFSLNTDTALLFHSSHIFTYCIYEHTFSPNPIPLCAKRPCKYAGVIGKKKKSEYPGVEEGWGEFGWGGENF